MALISKMLGRRRDMPFMTNFLAPAAAAPTANDYEYTVFTVPNLSALVPSPAGAVGDLPVNAVACRAIYLSPLTTITGQATNFFSYSVNVRRNLGVNTTATATIASGSAVVTPVGGSLMNNIQVGTRLDIGAVGTPETVAVTAVTATTFTATFANTHTFAATPITIVNAALTPFMAIPVNTTSATTIVASTMVVTPVSMSNIVPGLSLVLSAGTGATETVIVQSTTATTFTATFANGHSGAYTIVQAPLAIITYNAASVVTQALNAFLFNPPGVNNVLLPGDIATIYRNANNITGLATPASTWLFEWVPARMGG